MIPENLYAAARRHDDLKQAMHRLKLVSGSTTAELEIEWPCGSARRTQTVKISKRAAVDALAAECRTLHGYLVDFGVEIGDIEAMLREATTAIERQAA